MDLMPFVNKAGCECLNESDDCGFDNCLIKDSSYLESDCDEQVCAPHMWDLVVSLFLLNLSKRALLVQSSSFLFKYPQTIINMCSYIVAYCNYLACWMLMKMFLKVTCYVSALV